VYRGTIYFASAAALRTGDYNALRNAFCVL
jgi:hypothetical protein